MRLAKRWSSGYRTPSALEWPSWPGHQVFYEYLCKMVQRYSYSWIHCIEAPRLKGKKPSNLFRLSASSSWSYCGKRDLLALLNKFYQCFIAGSFSFPHAKNTIFAFSSSPFFIASALSPLLFACHQHNGLGL